ncbi:MAG: electron transport complex subunit RsxG [Candidatus Thiodiazotropha weberae]|nr:electron transport complex subunit RsxG [Candidatus Thiodiazotropha lotti]MCG8019248.1 electron transport complex subunit RsxG [Candidatus Thiodiazotropha lotti]MCW4206407.1 electron transport complex subunit RsxG [Candidatus Thiodiazotropha lotti]MCW4217775.1 electron transport complex subunit RsxG [Candidatus Thiodiazotropha lotti]
MKRAFQNWYKLIAAGLVLGLFAAFGVSMVTLVHEKTAQQIIDNRLQETYRAFDRVLRGEAYDNRPLDHPTQLAAVDWLNGGEPITIYTAKRDGQPVATLLRIDAQKGYNGSITLMLGILANGTLSGVEVVSHRETPGLGDKIESRRSDWLEQFEGRSLNSPAKDQWGVKRDGGLFDQITGATVTSRSVVMSLKQALSYLQQLRPELFERVEPSTLLKTSKPLLKHPDWITLQQGFAHTRQGLLI